MKIVGYQTKGNMIRFYLGSPDLKPKFKKSGTWGFKDNEPMPPQKAVGIYPYSDFVIGYRDIVVAWDKTVFTNQYTPIEDVRNRIAPLVVIFNSDEADTPMAFNKYKSAKDAICYYFWDDMEPDFIGSPDNYPGVGIDD